MNESTEQEWQFGAPELEAARRWLAIQPKQPTERRLAERPTLNLSDTYYDSPDWMIFRAGFALRLRQERTADTADEHCEITLKSLNGARGSLARRTEITQRVDASDMDAVLATGAGIGERIRELIGSRQLAPLFKARTRRERQHLLEADSELPLAEVDLDETTIETPSGAARELRRVEVECLNATPAALESFVTQLRDAANLQPVSTTKFRAGLSAAGLDPTAVAEVGNLEIRAAQPFADTQFALLRRYFARVLEQEPALRTGSTEAVHQMRVAARHIDALLRLFAGYGPRWALSSRKTLRALIRALGAVRDCDVQLEYLAGASARLPETDGQAIAPLRARLEQQRGKARARLLHLLDSDRTRGWMQNWQEQLQANGGSGARARKAATSDVVPGLIREYHRKLRKHADRLKDDSSAEEFHDVRIRAKRLRHALDAFEALYGEPARAYSNALARLQNVLGELHDSTVRTEKFAQLVTSGRQVPAATSFAVGRLVEREQQVLERCRRKFPKAYQRIKRRRWRTLLETMRAQMRSSVPTPE